MSKAQNSPPQDSSPAPAKGESISRRDFLDIAVAGTATLTGVGIAVPSLVFIWPPEAVTKRAGDRVKVATTEEVGPGKAKTVLLNGKPVLVINTGKQYIALMAACPHLGCVVKWVAAKNEILCPCHGAIFDVRGNLLSGPSPGPLSSTKVTVSGDEIYLG